MKIKRCPICENNIDKDDADSYESFARHGFDASFCTECGARLEEIEDPKRLECINCGKRIEKDHKFCGHCREKNKHYESDVMKYCPSCKMYKSDTAIFCSSCGTELVKVKKFQVDCPKCNRKISRTSKHCYGCGEENPQYWQSLEDGIDSD